MERCNICGDGLSTNNTLLISDVPASTFDITEEVTDLHVISCENCGCVQLYDVPLSNDYLAVYRSMGLSKTYRENKKIELKSIVDKYNLGSSIMEIGCGNGQILEMLREIGVECVGLEYDESNCNECLEKGFSVHNGVVGDLKDNYNTFFMIYYLEHIPEPVSFMKAVYDKINYNGVVIIEVPNFDYIEKNGIWLEFTKDHRFYYRKRTLINLLSLCGFTVEDVYDNTLCLTVIARKLDEDYDFSCMKYFIEYDTSNFINLVKRLDNNFCVYGAGHYSQLLLNILYKKEGIKPKHIFDSNDKKCGKYVCGVEVLGKDKLSGCENIIVICGMYNDEVYHMLDDLNIFKGIIKWD